ncbi:hypothetical protein RRG08_000410, partial [Elysia crispata]
MKRMSIAFIIRQIFILAATVTSGISQEVSSNEPVWHVDCDEPGWFGPECIYKCHCSKSTCNSYGFCEDGCEDEWFGPNCQYRASEIMVEADGVLHGLNMSDKYDCVHNNYKELVVRLVQPHPFSWLRITSYDLHKIKRGNITLLGK